jgi:Phosphotransferase enzyme family
MAFFDYEPYRSGHEIGSFPQMRWCFNTNSVRDKLSAVLHDDLHAEHGRIIDVYHRPGKDLDVCHALMGSGGKEVVVTLRCSPPGRGGHAFRKARKRAADPAKIVHFDDHTFAWMFPEDAELPALREFVSGGTSRTRLLSYRRGARCTMHLNDGAEVIKFHAHAQASQQRLAGLFAHPARRFAMPEPLGFDSRLGARRESFAAGTSFDTHARSEGLAASCKRVLVALADLHSLQPVGLDPFTADGMLRRYNQMFLRRLSLADARLRSECQQLGKALEISIPASCDSPATLHGDMHTGNVLFDDRTAILIDLDESVAGDRAYDLAILAGDLLLRAALQAETSQACLDAACAIPDVYQAASRTAVNPRTFAWYVAAILASRQIKSCINHCAPDFDRVTARLSRMALGIAVARDVKAVFRENARE